jgi:hypothetical protein
MIQAISISALPCPEIGVKWSLFFLGLLEAVLRRTSVFDLLALSVSTQPKPTIKQVQIKRR